MTCLGSFCTYPKVAWSRSLPTRTVCRAAGAGRACPRRQAGRVGTGPRSWTRAAENALFLCSSRACLGKLTVFAVNIALQAGVFRTQSVTAFTFPKKNFPWYHQSSSCMYATGTPIACRASFTSTSPTSAGHLRTFLFK
jgi:hypothetical protein